MADVLPPRESGEFIAEHAKHVKINDAGVKALADEIIKRLKTGQLGLSAFSQCDVHPQTADEFALDWLFVVDTLNFCFWSPGPKKWEVTYKNKTHTGYFAFCAAINRAIDEGYKITDPKYYSQISMKDLKMILRGDSESCQVPLLKERLDSLHQVGTVLLEKFDGKFLNCLRKCNNSAKKLVELIVSNFECFKDEAVYNNQKVAIYKRVQILVGDIWAGFKGKGFGYFHDIDWLTMFADYRIPQVLIHFKAMEYTNELMEKLKTDSNLESGCEEEVEIRGCSIHAVELTLKEIKRQLPDLRTTVPKDGNEDDDYLLCNSVVIDHFLWDYRRQHAEELEHIPFHKTLGIYY